MSDTTVSLTLRIVLIGGSMGKTVAISDDAYQFLRARSDASGQSIRSLISDLVEEKRIGSAKKKTNSQGDEALLPEEVDAGMGYERKPDEVTARDGISGLFATSHGYKDLGRDNS
jgi:predicted CopG family antitoxin